MTAWDGDAFRRDVLAHCDREGWSGRALAGESGVAVGSVLGWLRGDAGLSLGSAAAIAVACGLSMDDYVRGAA